MLNNLINTIQNIDCLEGFKLIPDKSIDLILTDPPYGLEFMGRAWDKIEAIKDGRFCSWLAGFTDGEGNFDIHRQVRNGKEYYYCCFEITLREDDNAILEFIKSKIGGKVYYHSNKSRLELVAKEECKRLTTIFEQYPLQAKKKRDFEIWKRALKITVDNDRKPNPELMKPYWKALRATRENKGIDKKIIDFDYGEYFHYLWATECLRILKPGGYLLSFGGTRTYHRMTCAIEDAGFEIRDCICWLYASGFPKSLNIGKQVDKIQGNEREVMGIQILKGNAGVSCKEKGGTYVAGASFTGIKDIRITKGNSEWEGWGTALKPAFEPIVVARKPLSEKNVASNVLKWGTGGINVDGSRIGTKIMMEGRAKPSGSGCYQWNKEKKEKEKIENPQFCQGRFPANLILDEESAKELDRQSGINRSKRAKISNKGSIWGKGNLEEDTRGHNDVGGASRFFYVAKASKRERDMGCEGLEEITKTGMNASPREYDGKVHGEVKLRNNHPTVKPLKLMEYLVKLVTPPKGIVLDPFAGSGTTCMSCKKLGFNYIGIEQDKSYCEIAEARIKSVKEDLTLF